ncbi:MAG: hypothetical protein ACPHCN_18845 [Mycobacterium sp.]
MPTICLDTCAKTTLAAVKRQANISASNPTYDAKLTDYINAASAKITSLLGGREVCAKDYVHWLDGHGSDELMLPQWPIQRVNMLATGSARALTLQYTGSDVRASAQVGETGLRLASWGIGGTTNTLIPWTSATAGTTLHETIGEVVTQVNDNVTDWTATLVTDGPAAWLRPAGGRDAKTAALTLDAADCIDHDYEVKHATGLIQFRGRGHGPNRPAAGMGIGGTFLAGETPMGGLRVLADYRAGFEAVPADIEQVARAMAVAMYDQSYRDGSIKSESLGGYSYTLADQVTMDAGWQSVLDTYGREVLA